MSQPPAEFDWEVYANATFAGLSTLIPIPLIDWLFEEFFRRRILASIAKCRAQEISPEVIEELNQRESITGKGWLRGCASLVLLITYGLLKRISRKILYFLTIKEATDKVNYYWHQAFLIDYMLLLKHLNSRETTQIARESMDEVLQETTTGPLAQLAQQITEGTRHIFKTLRRVRKGQEDEVVEQKKSQMIQQWADFDDYFIALADHYVQTYDEIKIHQDAKPEETGSKDL